MSTAAVKTLKCTKCARTIESCACCDEQDCPPPTCYTSLSEDLAKWMRRAERARWRVLDER